MVHIRTTQFMHNHSPMASIPDHYQIPSLAKACTCLRPMAEGTSPINPSDLARREEVALPAGIRGGAAPVRDRHHRGCDPRPPDAGQRDGAAADVGHRPPIQRVGGGLIPDSDPRCCG